MSDTGHARAPEGRCQVCGWPLAESADKGCVPGDCSMRPRPNPTYAEQIEHAAAVREALATYAHEAWFGWMRYLFTTGTFNDDGTWTMPRWAVERWTRQATTHYNGLPEDEKAGDRDEADKMLAIVARFRP